MARESQREAAGQPKWSARHEQFADPRTHRWQGAGGGGGGPRIAQATAASRRLRRRLWLMLALSLALSAAFVYALLFTPVKTPLIILSATDYAWPVPPLAWAQEDVDGLKTLDDKTLRVVDTSAAWRSRKSGMAEFERRLREAAGRRGNDGAVLFYVAMHGNVDENGEPALLPAGASPLKSAEWLPVEELLNRTAEILPADVQKVLIFDCVRSQSDWNLGVVRNTFAERLAGLVARKQIANLHVLTAAGPGEVNWASPDLRGSVFGRAVRHALAGAGDRSETVAADAPKVGNRNSRVSARELHQFVTAQVRTWALANRAAEQNPQLHPPLDDAFGDFRLAWSLDRPNLRRMLEAEAALGRAPDNVKLDDLAALWKQYDEVDAVKPYQVDPLSWRNLQHRLLWLEQLAEAGGAYRETAERVLRELRTQLSAAATQAVEARRNSSFVLRRRVLDPQAGDLIAAAKFHSLALNEYFGAVSAADAEAIRNRLQLLAAPGNADDLALGWDKLARPDLPATLAETQFLRLARRYQAAGLWKQGDVVRQGLALHDRAEAAGVGADPRAQFWLTAVQAEADQARRAADDALLVGPESAESSPWAGLNDALDELATGPDSLRTRTETALAVYDRAAADAPYLAAWLCRPNLRVTVKTPPADDATPPGKPAPPTKSDDVAKSAPQSDDPVNLRLTPLLLNIRKLGELIDDRAQPATDAAPSFIEQARLVDGERRALVDELSRLVDERLNEAGADAATLRDLQAALSLPLLPADKRIAVLKKATALATQLSQPAPAASAAQQTAAPQTSVPAIGVAASFPQRVLGWHPHPLETLLGIAAEPTNTAAATPAPSEEDADPQDDLAVVEQLGAVVRRRLVELPTLPLTDAARADDDPRPVFAATARELRLAAAVAYAEPEVDPFERLLRLDLQTLLLADVRRTLDDFWGPTDAASSLVGAATPTPYFDLAATDHLSAAEALLPPSPSAEAAVDKLQRLLDARRVAAQLGVAAAVETSLEEAAQDEVRFTMLLKPAADMTSDAAAKSPPGLPPGRGIVIARNTQDVLPIPRAAWTSPVSASGERIKLAGVVPPDRGSSFEAVAALRGNEFRVPFLRSGLGGVIVEYAPTAPDTAQVTLFGDKPQQASVIFLLDCSASMGAEMPVELIDADRLPRLEIAKSALESLLEQLAVRADTRVGVRFFGHRTGWAKGEMSKLLTQNNYAGPIPDDVSPSEDVELVLPLGRFDSVEAGQVTSRLKSVVPWGQSPLYLAIEQSLRDFDRDQSDSERSIVVITDGANYQFTPAGGAFAAPAHRTLNDVLAAERGKNVPIYILGFGVSESGDAAAEREFTTLAEQSGGRYFPISNGRDLLTTLRERLGLGSYEVASGQLTDAGRPTTRLNAPVTVAGLKHGPAKYDVRFQNASRQVVLEGGEALELYALRNGEIVSRPYERGLPVEAVLSAEGQPRRLTVRAHRPERAGESVRFPISFQENDALFTPRPTEVWIEITPVVKDATTDVPTYVFYDRRFEPGAPVPLTNWTATHWPRESAQARVQVWCKYSPTTPSQTVPLTDVVKDRESFLVSRPVAALPGATYRVQLSEKLTDDAPYEIKIIEEHGQASPNIPALKVELETAAGLLPQRVVRRFDARNRVAIHSFWFHGAVARKVLDSAESKIAFTLRRATREGAWQIDGGRPLIVDILGSGDVLPLDAATGVR